MALTLSSCAGFPDIRPYKLSLKNNKCAEYKIIRSNGACDVVYEFVKWHDISDCEGFYALSQKDVAALKEYQALKCEVPK